VTGDSGREEWLRQARAYLRDADPVLARLIEDRPDFDPRAWLAQLPPMDLFGALLFQVTGQQLSVAATRRILARIGDLFGGRLPGPAELLAADPGDLRAAGLSWRKVGTLRELAGRLADGRLDQDALSALPDEEVIAELTTIPGIGPWTAQGALLLALGREDVVLPGDLALRKAIRAAYQLDHLPAQQEVLTIAAPWRPYRSLATSYLFSAAGGGGRGAHPPPHTRPNAPPESRGPRILAACLSTFITSSLTLTTCRSWPGSGRRRLAGRSSPSRSARSSSALTRMHPSACASCRSPIPRPSRTVSIST
jgi:DNA-3-methyladenine glycosylase II